MISAWQAVLKLEPGHRSALDALETLYTRMNRWPDLVRILQSRIEAAEDDDERLVLHSQISSIMLERFSNTSEAIKHLQAILDLDSENVDAMGQLKGLYEQRKNWEKYIDVARREIVLTTEDDAERSVALIALAKLASEQIRQPSVGVALWEEIRAADPGNAEAVEQLVGLYERERKYDKLAEILEVRYEHCNDDGDRVAILDKMGTIWGVRLKDAEKTSEIWRRVLSLDSSHRKAFNELRKSALSSQDWEALEWLFRSYGSIGELVRTLDAQVHSLDDGSKIPLLRRVADLNLEDGKNGKAIKAFASIMIIDPKNADAASQLVPLYEGAEAWQDLPDVIDVVIDATEEVEFRQALLVKKAKVHENQLDDLDAAFFCYVTAIGQDHENNLPYTNHFSVTLNVLLED
ncbi:MAG TPA: hypothetical protein EYN66_24080 [Myxococcales bacterium]|nr:hypothetical protein [Myxococcales bacterium]